MRYLHYDVFTDRRFEGNQLAIFPDARGLDPALMQTIAREINFSETTFVLPAESAGTDVRMRIFTPGAELPMAGHPTIGTTFALADEGVIRPGRDVFVFGLGVGPTPVELAWKDGRLDFAWMDQRPPDVRTPAATTADIVRAAGLDPASVERTRLPIEEISCGVPYIIVPVDSRAAVDEAEPDPSRLRVLANAFGSHVAVYLFSGEGGEPGVASYSRMFASGLGVLEDPATGSAAGPLGCYLVRHGLASGEMLNLQGVKMGRPSRLHIRIGQDAAGQVTRVQVGGRAVRIASGAFTAPA